jgi:hypothetical protein
MVKPPRAVFVDFPLGRQCGKPHDPDLQLSILKDALGVLAMARTPGTIVDLPYEWGEPFDWESYQRGVQEMIRQEGTSIQEWGPR